jgi:hypothetical protein
MLVVVSDWIGMHSGSSDFPWYPNLDLLSPPHAPFPLASCRRTDLFRASDYKGATGFREA